TMTVVDSLIFFSREWRAFNLLLTKQPMLNVIWMTLEITGRLFPDGRKGDFLISQQQDIISLRNIFRRLTSLSANELNINVVTPIPLKSMEMMLLPLFVLTDDILFLSQSTGIAVKTLYAHRMRILIKTGFRTIQLFRYVFARNKWNLNIKGAAVAGITKGNEITQCRKTKSAL